MKNLTIILIILILSMVTGCKPKDSQETPPNYIPPPIADPTSDVPPPVVADPTPDTPPPPPEPDPTIKLALLTDKLYLYDGINFTDQSADSPKYCGYRCFTDGTKLNLYDGTGDVYAFENLPVKPDSIYKSDRTYLIENIDPATALSLGARYKNYSKIYIDGIEQQWWFFNQYLVKDLFQTGTDTFTKDSIGIVRDINETLTDINTTNGLIVWNFDSVARTAKIRTPDGQDYPVSWGLNYFNNAEYWQSAGGVWYSNNGYQFENGILTSGINALWVFNAGEIIISAGTNGEVSYWIDASSGWLYRLIPPTNILEQRWRLYPGDGVRSTGQAKRDTLNPVLIGSELYFSDGGAVWVVDIDTGLIEVFYGGNGRVVGF